MPNIALYRSEDGGKTISIVRGAPGGDDYHQLWVDPKNSSHLILGTDQGTTISLNRGQTWSSWYNQPTAQFYHVITDNEFPYHVYGAQQDTGCIAVPNRTDHGMITGRDWYMVGGGESGWLAPDPSDPNILYASGVYGSVVRWDRRTSLSQDITPWPMQNFGSEINERKYRDPWTPMLVLSPIEKNTLYLGTQYRDEDHRRRPALDRDQSGPDRCYAGAASDQAGHAHDRRERQAARLWRGLQHCAVAAQGRRDLGRQRYRAASSDARRRQELAGRHSHGPQRTGARSR